ncbi:hypothetical protein LUZ63_006654 [Rhynchospora breviuscula]|uniref:Uncharacterized protein n=1 Tax=Rhynchospora breviuscula TaxID=2022672 RepID=A0A9Q0HTQ5_9POAL|nr:hypothetical protein LUZ63_006654 [Rhynchospora breviuscula]
MEYCNTELCLSSGGKATSICRLQEEKPITIIYRGQMFTCDATEIQAREIICKAQQQMEKSCTEHLEQNESINDIEDSIVSLKANSGLSMKRSLQRFLHQRRCLKRRTLSDESSSN